MEQAHTLTTLLSYCFKAVIWKYNTKLCVQGHCSEPNEQGTWKYSRSPRRQTPFCMVIWTGWRDLHDVAQKGQEGAMQTAGRNQISGEYISTLQKFTTSLLQFCDEHVGWAGDCVKCLRVKWTKTTAFKPLNSWPVVNF